MRTRSLGTGKHSRARKDRTKSEQHLLQRGQHAINCLNGQLDQLLGAVRLYEHSKEAKLSPVALEPLFRQACHENAESALQKGLTSACAPLARPS